MTVTKEKDVLLRTKNNFVITKRLCVSSLLIQELVNGPPILVNSRYLGSQRSYQKYMSSFLDCLLVIFMIT